MNRQQRMRVLLVDDDVDVKDALETGLRTRGYHVQAYDDPTAALADFVRDSYDVAVLDVRMRPFDGLELYRRLRLVEPGLAICFLTAYADTIKEWPSDALLLQKPISLDGLELALEDVETRIGSDK
ncbi:MAG: response regulator [Thaumarchaeota archaeon]|nr:response regulator [Nitrososphaerota archaeon]